MAFTYNTYSENIYRALASNSPAIAMVCRIKSLFDVNDDNGNPVNQFQEYIIQKNGFNIERDITGSTKLNCNLVDVDPVTESMMSAHIDESNKRLIPFALVEIVLRVYGSENSILNTDQMTIINLSLVGATYQLGKYDTLCEVRGNNDSTTILLPSPLIMPEQYILIKNKATNLTSNIGVTYNSSTIGELDAYGDMLLFYSNGSSWTAYEIFEEQKLFDGYLIPKKINDDSLSIECYDKRFKLTTTTTNVVCEARDTYKALYEYVRVTPVDFEEDFDTDGNPVYTYGVATGWLAGSPLTTKTPRLSGGTARFFYTPDATDSDKDSDQEKYALASTSMDREAAAEYVNFVDDKWRGPVENLAFVNHDWVHLTAAAEVATGTGYLPATNKTFSYCVTVLVEKDGVLRETYPSYQYKFIKNKPHINSKLAKGIYPDYITVKGLTGLKQITLRWQKPVIEGYTVYGYNVYKTEHIFDELEGDYSYNIWGTFWDDRGPKLYGYTNDMDFQSQLTFSAKDADDNDIDFGTSGVQVGDRIYFYQTGGFATIESIDTVASPQTITISNPNVVGHNNNYLFAIELQTPVKSSYIGTVIDDGSPLFVDRVFVDNGIDPEDLDPSEWKFPPKLRRAIQPGDARLYRAYQLFDGSAAQGRFQYAEVNPDLYKWFDLDGVYKITQNLRDFNSTIENQILSEKTTKKAKLKFTVDDKSSGEYPSIYWGGYYFKNLVCYDEHSFFTLNGYSDQAHRDLFDFVSTRTQELFPGNTTVYKTVIANTTIIGDNVVLICDTNTAAANIGLELPNPNTVSPGKTYAIHNTGNTYNVIITDALSYFIDGASPIGTNVLTLGPGEKVVLRCQNRGTGIDLNTRWNVMNDFYENNRFANFNTIVYKMLSPSNYETNTGLDTTHTTANFSYDELSEIQLMFDEDDPRYLEPIGITRWKWRFFDGLILDGINELASKIPKNYALWYNPATSRWFSGLIKQKLVNLELGLNPDHILYNRKFNGLKYDVDPLDFKSRIIVRVLTERPENVAANAGLFELMDGPGFVGRPEFDPDAGGGTPQNCPGFKDGFQSNNGHPKKAIGRILGVDVKYKGPWLWFDGDGNTVYGYGGDADESNGGWPTDADTDPFGEPLKGNGTELVSRTGYEFEPYILLDLANHGRIVDSGVIDNTGATITLSSLETMDGYANSDYEKMNRVLAEFPNAKQIPIFYDSVGGTIRDKKIEQIILTPGWSRNTKAAGKTKVFTAGYEVLVAKDKDILNAVTDKTNPAFAQSLWNFDNYKRPGPNSKRDNIGTQPPEDFTIDSLTIDEFRYALILMKPFKTGNENQKTPEAITTAIRFIELSDTGIEANIEEAWFEEYWIEELKLEYMLNGMSELAAEAQAITDASTIVTNIIKQLGGPNWADASTGIAHITEIINASGKINEVEALHLSRETLIDRMLKTPYVSWSGRYIPVQVGETVMVYDIIKDRTITFLVEKVRDSFSSGEFITELDGRDYSLRPLIVSGSGV